MWMKEEEFKKGNIAIWKEDIKKKRPKRWRFDDSDDDENDEELDEAAV